MIAVDSNILVYAHQTASPHHAKAARAMRYLDGRGQWAVPWPCVHEFYGIITHPRIRQRPTPIDSAVAVVSALVDSDGVVLLGETERHWEVLRGLVVAAAVVGPMVHDARVAAICIEHGVTEFWSADRDFGRFAALKAVNPLLG